MSKKANLITLRDSAKKSFIFSINNSKETIKNFIFIKNFVYFLQSRGYWILKTIYIKTFDFCKFFLDILITRRNIYKFKKLKQPKKFIEKKQLSLNKLSKLFYNYLSNINSFIRFNILNNLVNIKTCRAFDNILQKFKKTLFNRKLNFYYDTLKFLGLYYEKDIHASNLLYILVNIFQHLSKKLHKVFFKFLKAIMLLLIKSTKNLLRAKPIRGFKYKLNGRIKGKMRASTYLTTYGRVPNQTMEENIEYGFSHVFTRYGTFGMHLWILK
jgi:hypothetical protein